MGVAFAAKAETLSLMVPQQTPGGGALQRGWRSELDVNIWSRLVAAEGAMLELNSGPPRAAPARSSRTSCSVLSACSLPRRSG